MSWRWPAFLALLTLAAAMMTASPASAVGLHRLYNFEDGTPGATADMAIDTIADSHLIPASPNLFGGTPVYAFDHNVPTTNDAVPGDEPLQSWITANVNPTPPLEVPDGAAGPTVVDVSDGMPMDSPSAIGTSTRALSFDGSTQVLQGAAFHDAYVVQEAYDTDALAAGNIGNTFFNFSQAWVYPNSAGQGTQQTVWSIGDENGGVQVSSSGFWELTALGGAVATSSLAAVAFDDWTHIAVTRTGGGATLYVNGSVAATAAGSFGKWGDFVTLGGDEDFFELLNGMVDDFSVGGVYDASFNAFNDVAFFEDTGQPQPTGVPGDVDQDGDADIDDYLIWSDNVGFNNGLGTGDVTTLTLGDVDFNGRVDFFDFTQIAAGAAAAGNALDLSSIGVPEPATATFVALGALAGLLIRRRI
jgi:hypothetical protein